MDEWTRTDQDDARKEGPGYEFINGETVGRMLAEIDRAWGEIERLHNEANETVNLLSDARREEERLTLRLRHARDAANRLYQAAQRVCDDYVRGEDGETPAIRDLRSALDSTEAEASAREAARRDGLEKEIESLRAAIESITGPQATDAERIDALAKAWRPTAEQIEAQARARADDLKRLVELQDEVDRLRTELRDAIEAHEEADERAERASRGLSEAEAGRWARDLCVSLGVEPNDTVADALIRASHGEPPSGATRPDGAVWHWRTPLFAIGCNERRAHKRATTEIARVTCPACLAALRSPQLEVHVEPPNPDRPVDASLEARADRRKAAQILIEEIGAPGPETFEETATRAVAEIRRLRAVGASRPKPRVTNAANQRATMEAAVVLGEEPPTQPPRRERHDEVQKLLDIASRRVDAGQTVAPLRYLIDVLHIINAADGGAQ